MFEFHRINVKHSTLLVMFEFHRINVKHGTLLVMLMLMSSAAVLSLLLLSGRLIDLAPSSSTADEDASFAVNDKTTKWYRENSAVKALEEALASSLTKEEMQQWFAEPSPLVSKSKTGCPRPKEFERPAVRLPELGFSEQQKNDLKAMLTNGTSTSIRKAFWPWIKRGGFHPDLILHAGNLVGLLVGVFDGKLFFWRRYDGPVTEKEELLAEHLESVMEEFHRRGIKIPDVIFPYSQGSIVHQSLLRHCARRSLVPPHLQGRYETAPVAAIAMEPHLHNGVALLPNMYFGNIRAWDRFTKQLLTGGKVDTPWAKRSKRVFWRGKIGYDFRATLARLEAWRAAARDSKTSPSLLDISLTGGCQRLQDFAAKLTEDTSPQSPLWLPDAYVTSNASACGHSQVVHHTNYTNYWAHVNLPGSATGSYSKNLQNLWPTGSAVMIWEQAAVEFYYDELKTGVTHIWVNETTIEPMAAKLFQDEGKLARLLGSVAREWFVDHLTGKSILEYYRQWFRAWASLQRFVPSPDVLPDGCTCAGWADSAEDVDGGVKRCSWCAEYPSNTFRGCSGMMVAGSKKEFACDPTESEMGEM